MPTATAARFDSKTGSSKLTRRPCLTLSAQPLLLIAAIHQQLVDTHTTQRHCAKQHAYAHSTFLSQRNVTLCGKRIHQLLVNSRYQQQRLGRQHKASPAYSLPRTYTSYECYESETVNTLGYKRNDCIVSFNLTWREFFLL